MKTMITKPLRSEGRSIRTNMMEAKLSACAGKGRRLMDEELRGLIDELRGRLDAIRL